MYMRNTPSFLHSFIPSLLLFFALTGSAAAREHLQFHDIDITGPIASFTAQLEQQTGWTRDADMSSDYDVFYAAKESGMTYFVEVQSTPASHTVCAVVLHYLMFPPEKWEDAKRGFDNVVAMYKDLFGPQTRITEEFLPPYSPTNKPIEGIRKGLVTIKHVFMAPGKGTVTLEMKGLGEETQMILIQVTLLDEEGERLRTAEVRGR